MKKYLFFLWIPVLLQACIGDDIIDDFVEPTLRITTLADSIAVNDTFQFGARYTNNVGIEQVVPKTWISSAPSILSVDNNGQAIGLQKGSATISVELETSDGQTLMDMTSVEVSENTVVGGGTMERTGTIRTTSSYPMEGAFTLTMDDDKLIINIEDDYRADSRLPGLYVYLTNNPNTTNGAHEIGMVDVYNGAHTYELENVDINDFDYLLYFCKPFNVKVGDGEISK